MKTYLHVSTCLSAGMLGLLFASSAVAQDKAPQGQQPSTADSQVVVVTGFRSSLQKALNLKREAIGVRDSIVAEDLGKFPEQNLAESLQRVPGVYLQRDGGSGEGNRISLRGLGAQYTVTTLNGELIHTTSGAGGNIGASDRSFNFDVFASEMFGRVDVYKTPLAELEEGGLAGVVDLRTPRPFDKPGRVIRYGAQETYNDQAKKYNPRYSFLFSDTWGPFGFLLTYAHSDNLNRNQGFQSTGSYNTPGKGGTTGTATPGATTGPFQVVLDMQDPRANLGSLSLSQVQNAYISRFFRAYASQNTRGRDGITGSLQYKPNDKLDVSLDILYAHLSDRRDEYTFGLPIRSSVTTVAGRPAAAGSPGHTGLVPINVFIDGNNNLQGTFGNTDYFGESFFYDADTNFSDVHLNAKYQFTPDLKISGQIGGSKSKALYTNNRLVENIWGVTSTIDSSQNPFFPEISTTANVLDKNIYVAPSVQYAFAIEYDRTKNARFVVDYDYRMPFDFTGHLKVGASYQGVEKQVLKQNGTALATTALNTLYPGNTLNQQMVAMPFSGFTSNENAGFPKTWMAFSRDFMYDKLNPYTLNLAAPLDYSNSFQTEENVKSVFVQSDFEGKVLDRTLRANIGIRSAVTETVINNYTKVPVKDANGNIVTSGGQPVTKFVPNHRDGHYQNYLPSVSIAYDITPDLVWRGSFGSTITRAPLSIIAANTVIPNIFNPVATSGNPNLLPQRANQTDTGVEWYFGKGSVLSFSLFWKRLKDATQGVTQTVPFSSLGLPDEALGPTFQDPATHKVDPNLPIQLTTFFNAGLQKFHGLEIGYQQQFTSLPAPWDGLGFLASYTHITDTGNTWTSNAGQAYHVSTVPEWALSTTLYYEKGPFAVRGSYNYRDKSILETGNNGSDLQRWTAGRGIFDANMSYKLNGNLELRVDGLNLGNAKTYEFFDNPTGAAGKGTSRVDNALYNGRTLLVGVRGKF